MTVIFYLLLISTAIQLYYFLWPYSALVFYRSPELPTNSQAISVIICAHNELENLKVLIPLLRQQKYSAFEVVIALDRCEDGSAQWLASTEWDALEVIEITQVPSGVNPKKNALVNALKAAHNDVVLLTDADCYPHDQNWMQEMTAGCQAPIDIVLGYSAYERRPGLLNQFIQYETLLVGVQYLSSALRGQPYMGVGRNLCYRKSYFLNTANLSKVMHITGGDDDLFVNQFAHQSNTDIRVGPPSLVWSQPKISFKSYFKQKIRHLSVGKHYSGRDRLALGLFSLSHIIFWSSLVSLLVTTTQSTEIISILVVRLGVMFFVLNRSGKHLANGLNWILLPFLDLLLSIYYLSMGPLALTRKKINWN